MIKNRQKKKPKLDTPTAWFFGWNTNFHLVLMQGKKFNFLVVEPKKKNK